MDSDFKKDIESGKINLQCLNIEDSNNRHFVEKYSLVTKSIVLSRQKNGEEVKWKNLDQIWTRVHNENDFKHYVISEIQKMLETSTS
jgi:hypothetical protein